MSKIKSTGSLNFVKKIVKINKKKSVKIYRQKSSKNAIFLKTSKKLTSSSSSALYTSSFSRCSSPSSASNCRPSCSSLQLQMPTRISRSLVGCGCSISPRSAGIRTQVSIATTVKVRFQTNSALKMLIFPIKLLKISIKLFFFFLLSRLNCYGDDFHSKRIFFRLGLKRRPPFSLAAGNEVPAD